MNLSKLFSASLLSDHLMRTVFLTFLLFVTLPASVFGQTTADSSLLIDEIGPKHNCEDLLSRLDAFAIELQKRKATGVVLFYRSEDIIRDIFTYRLLQSHKVVRRIGEAYDVVAINDTARSGIQFWIGSPPEKLQHSAPTFKLGLSSRSDPVYFSGGLYERVKIDNESTFINWDCSACCISWLDLGLLSEFLTENSGTKAYFVLRGNRSRADLLKKYLRNEATEAGLPQARIRFIYAGSKMVNDSGKFIEVEAFISNADMKSHKAFPYQLTSDLK